MTPDDVYFGRREEILAKRMPVKRTDFKKDEDILIEIPAEVSDKFNPSLPDKLKEHVADSSKRILLLTN